jgi:hypothetical protein
MAFTVTAQPWTFAGHLAGGHNQSTRNFHKRVLMHNRGLADHESENQQGHVVGPPLRESSTQLAKPDVRNVPDANAWIRIFHAVAMRAIQITGRIITQPFQPAQRRLRTERATSDGILAVCNAVKVEDLRSLRDLANASVLSESVYRIVGRSEAEAFAHLNGLKAAFPSGMVTLTAAQFAKPHVRQRFVVAVGDDAVYVAFMGTKLISDYFTNAAWWAEAVEMDASMLATDEPEDLGMNGNDRNTIGHIPPAAHKGFLGRAKAIPIEAIYQQARQRGKRLVLCG